VKFYLLILFLCTASKRPSSAGSDLHSANKSSDVYIAEEYSPKYIRHVSLHLPCRRGSCQLDADLLATWQTILTCQDVTNKSTTS